MVDELIELLESLGYTVYRQGSLAGVEYPDTFFTFWENDSPDHAHYDNQSYGTAYDFSVYVYSVDADLAYSLTEEARDILKVNGWVVPSKGYDVASDDNTHIGRGLQVYYLKTI